VLLTKNRFPSVDQSGTAHTWLFAVSQHLPTGHVLRQADVLLTKNRFPSVDQSGVTHT